MYVAGVDTSTQSCKVLICDAESGEVIRSAQAPHPPGTSIDPRHWKKAFDSCIEQLGGLGDIAALSVAGQQHGMIALDAQGQVLRDALLWNDTRSASQAQSLIDDIGLDFFIGRTGSAPVSSLTISKLRWFAENEPELFARCAAIALPHDWLSWQISTKAGDISSLFTDPSDASGTGYLDLNSCTYARDYIARATRDEDWAISVILPRIISPGDIAGQGVWEGHEFLLAGGCGDNAGAALGLGVGLGEIILSVGTSGVASVLHTSWGYNPEGKINSFLSADNHFLPLACTMNATQVIDAYVKALGIDYATFDRLALSVESGAEGLLMVPYLAGERTPNLPRATGSLLGIRGDNLHAAAICRAVCEGVLCGLRAAVDTLRDAGIEAHSIRLIGGGAKSKALATLAPAILELPVYVCEPAEYVALGAARQAAWVALGTPTAPEWPRPAATLYEADPEPHIYERYQENALFIERA